MATPTSNPIGLTREQEQDYIKLSAVKKYFEITANLAKVNAWTPLKNEYLLFKGNMDSLAPIVASKLVTSKGATISKNDLKKIAAETVSVYALVSRGFCLRPDINLSTVGAQLNYTENMIMHIEDGGVLDVVTAINKAITENLIPLLTFGPYGIDAVVLADGLAKATAFNDALGTAGAIMATKTASMGDIEEMFTKLHGNEVQFKHLMINFRLSDRNFYDGFVAADVEDDLIRHNNVAGTVSTTKQVTDPETSKVRNGLVPNATIKNLKSGKAVQTDLLGVYDHEPNRTGLTQFECSAPGYVTQTKIVTIKRGTTIHLDWVLTVASGDEGTRAVAN